MFRCFYTTKFNKMNIKSNLAIHFHQQDEASVFLENTANDREEKFGEILLFCLFALRTMSNFGNQPTAGQIAMLLSQMNGELKNFIKHEDLDSPRLIDYPGTQGRKKFIVTLNASDDNFSFKYKPKGFGILGKGINYYAPNAIFLLLRYLVNRRLKDKEFIKGLEKAATQCGEVFNNGNLAMSNEIQIATMIAMENYNSDIEDTVENRVKRRLKI